MSNDKMLFRIRRRMGSTRKSLKSLYLKQITTAVVSLESLRSKRPSAWEEVTAASDAVFNSHELHWWKTSGRALAVLLHNAGYSYAAQIRILTFFVEVIAPNLGVADEPGANRWKSFMTDDNNPIELSWDWHTGHQRPTIRFSVEPVGLDAGSALDPRNERAPAEFKESVLSALPDTDMRWFDHFEQYFNEGVDHHSPEGHQSKFFWAFDLGEKKPSPKAYFFPGYRAKQTGRSNLEVISAAIVAAPSYRAGSLDAFNMFVEYARGRSGPPLEMDMLAIDMIDVSKSRLKIYFRSRQTDFRSVRETMTLGGRVSGHEMEMGLQRLRRVWDSLFGTEGLSDDTPLPDVDHRTAGLLYNVEFRLGSTAPKVKIYIPVRHYARSDWQILAAVSGFVERQRAACKAKESTMEKYQPFAYAKAMYTIFNDDALLESRGLHTYIGCSVQPGGALRVVSYINPQHTKFRSRQVS
ncbi:hypothetical protein DL771_003411 [Monosporascus sp. 5C6A]|nr:hypothetical protein DL771_003411 [Monosporascus sp. 5C6A]